MDEWTTILDSGAQVDAIYTDFAKAFDTVPHQRLLSKLKSYGVSVYTGEMTAVKLAVENVRMLGNATQHTKFAVFTDSLSTAETFISGRANSRPALFAETCDLLNEVKGNIILVWLRSNIGVEGNEKADRLGDIGAK